MYANIIIDISHEKVDKPFQYKIPEALDSEIQVGVQVRIPFGKGNHERKGYVVGVTEEADFDPARIKEITGVVTGSVTAESKLIGLAWWMKGRYGSTMNQALKTVLPVKQKVRPKENRCLVCQLHGPDLKNAILEAGKKGYKARERLLKAFEDTPVIPYSVAAGQMNLTMASIKPLIEKQMITLESETVYRNPKIYGSLQKPAVKLNSRQAAIVSDFALRYEQGIRETSLLYGVTGSGKTEVYLEMIDLVLKQGKQVIVLIPEIALTYQTVLRFYRRFGSLVSIINSRMSAGERYDQFERAKRAEVRIMIGPRSALFTPFPSLGLLIIDEEHESAYKSELSPRYHARETAQKLAEMNHATLVLGSATPSLEAYTRALKGEYRLYRLTERAKKDSHMAQVQVVDLREELKNGNRSIFSEALQNAMKERLDKGQQIMLFLNRRGYSSFVSCRSCGEAVRCPHCDVTLTLHHKNRMKCHYCGYEIPLPDRCPACGSPYIAGFGTGTQKIETMTKNMFPQARVLRMDLDTTSKKGGHEEILSAFGEKEADILVGTQMIVKGHDFPGVTLVGALAADLSLHASDYRAAERTFQLLAQAAGRAGRGEKPGEVVIQTYSPEHYSIETAAGQDYPAFYQREILYRKLMGYPPAWGLLAVYISGPQEERLDMGAAAVRAVLDRLNKEEELQIIGPAVGAVSRVQDQYRRVIYIKGEQEERLIALREALEPFLEAECFASLHIQFDRNPMNGY